MTTLHDTTAGGWLSHKLEAVRLPEKGGYGMIAREWIRRGEVVAVWGGNVLTASQLTELHEIARRYSVQIEEDLYLVTTRAYDEADFINHSCEPNLGLCGQIALVAMRDIEPGEEACLDYAMCDGTAYDEFDCSCGSSSCRGRVTGDDWRRPELWDRYHGYFSPYLQRRIDRLRAEANLANEEKPSAAQPDGQ